MDKSSVYRVPAFEQLEWLESGFGTRESVSWPDSERLAMLRQIHSCTVVAVHGETRYLGEGDALMTDRPGVLVGVRTADCVPVLIADPERRAVAAVHAGWKGTAGEIVAATIAGMTERYATDPSDLSIAIGPAIGGCCYEVGPEVAERFRRWWPENDGRNGPGMLDLVEMHRRQLAGIGIRPDQIHGGGICTYCAANLHSYRRDGAHAGRMISAIGIRR